jgi:hypothetical protein
MKAILFNLCFLVFFIISCNKSPEEINSPAFPPTPPKAFVPVYLFGSPGNWGGGVCSWGWVMVREDTTGITYHATQLPGGITTLPANPISAKIQFHDTTNATFCYDDIVVDSIKF